MKQLVADQSPAAPRMAARTGGRPPEVPIQRLYLVGLRM
jgi:hypothetical protein